MPDTDATSGRSEADSVLVVLGGVGSADSAWLRAAVTDRAVVIAADSGVGVARASGTPVDHLVGDLDSASPSDVDWAVEGGAEVHRHASDKDATDGELALDLAIAVLGEHGRHGGHPGPGRLMVVGGGGGRLDHLLGDLVALTGHRLAPFEVTARFGLATVTVVRPGPGRTIVGRPGELVSLLAITEPALGITTTGLRWALEAGDLAPGSTRGTSNEIEEGQAHVSLRQGSLLVVQAGEKARAVQPRASAYDPSPRLS